jgi:hypothetical protein
VSAGLQASDRARFGATLAFEHLLWTIFAAVAWDFVVRATGASWRPEERAEYYAAACFIVFLPLAFVQIVGWLARQAADIRSRRPVSAAAIAGRRGRAVLPPWVAVQVAQAALSALAVNVLIVALVDLPELPLRWLLYNCEAMALTLYVVSSARMLCHPQTARERGAASGTEDDLDALWDWFGAAAIAAALGDLLSMALLVVAFSMVPAYMLEPREITAAILVPAFCTFCRRRAASAWRSRRRPSGAP